MMVDEMTGNLIIKKSRVKAIEEAEKENCPQCGEKRHKLMACSSCGCS